MKATSKFSVAAVVVLMFGLTTATHANEVTEAGAGVIGEGESAQVMTSPAPGVAGDVVATKKP